MTADLDFRNAARLGLFQVCLVVGGALGAAAMAIRLRDGGAVWAYFSGWAVIFVLLALVLGANVLPWLRLCLLTLSA